jgi:hypothetical protein
VPRPWACKQASRQHARKNWSSYNGAHRREAGPRAHYRSAAMKREY